MAAIVETRDIPRENLFMVGITSGVKTRETFVIARPRKPMFIINRAEALSLIGHLITKADFTVADIEQAIKKWEPRLNIFEVEGDDKRAIINPPVNARLFYPTQSPAERKALVKSAEMGLYLFNVEEAKILCASLVRVMELKPRELDAGVVAIFEHARDPSGFGESEEDLLKKPSSDEPR